MLILRRLADMTALFDEGLRTLCSIRSTILLDSHTEKMLDVKFGVVRDALDDLTTSLHQAARHNTSEEERHSSVANKGRREGQDG